MGAWLWMESSRVISLKECATSLALKSPLLLWKRIPCRSFKRQDFPSGSTDQLLASIGASLPSTVRSISHPIMGRSWNWVRLASSTLGLFPSSEGGGMATTTRFTLGFAGPVSSAGGSAAEGVLHARLSSTGTARPHGSTRPTKL